MIKVKVFPGTFSHGFPYSEQNGCHRWKSTTIKPARGMATMSSPVIVLGMHRSGTSFLVRALSLSGLWLGLDPELQTVDGRAFPGNPKGNYESREVAAINETVLLNSGGSWHQPPVEVVATSALRSNMQQFLAGLETGKPSEFPAWGWKDPRTILTLGCWQQVIDEKPVLVATFRHPQLVAQSLLARDGFPLERGYALWVHYNRLLLAHLGENPGVLLRFDVEPKVLLQQVGLACRFLGLETNLDAINEWFDQCLVRNAMQADVLSPRHQVATDVWEKLMTYYENQPIGSQ